MNSFKLFKLSNLALCKESELEIGKIFNNPLISKTYAKKNDKFFPLFFYAALSFVYRVLKKLILFEKKKPKSLYIFSGTQNQYNSIKPVLRFLSKKNYSFNNLKRVKFSTKIVIISFALFLVRGLPLHLNLKKKYKNKTYWYLYKLTESYMFIPYFLEELDRIQPKLIILSNDHSIYARSLRITAEILEIKTLYLQHASVSKIFPPLEFDYALLDGNFAYQNYIACYRTQKKNLRIKKNAANCQVLLSGQKKKITRVIKKKNNIFKENKTKKLCIGLAVNNLSDFNDTLNILIHLIKLKVKCIVRTHPSQNLIFIKKLKLFIKGEEMIRWSNPTEQSLLNYFENLDAIIAGETSIHLEAALAYLPTFYYKFSKKEYSVSDYYGYVKNNLSTRLDTNFSLKSLKFLIKKTYNHNQRNRAIKKYSETYETIWHNKEDELFKIIINRILNNKPLNDLFEIKKSNIYNSVGLLKL